MISETISSPLLLLLARARSNTSRRHAATTAHARKVQPAHRLHDQAPTQVAAAHPATTNPAAAQR
jgi:hypothetical protein